MLNVKWLEAFWIVVNSRTVTEAAAKLCISQPAVSRMLHSLEEEIGFALFTRRNARLAITPEGEKFFREVERALVSLKEVERIGNSIKHGGGTVLRLFAMSSFVNEVIPGAARQLRKSFPTILTTLEIRGGRDATHWGAGRQFDLGLVLLPSGYEMTHAERFCEVQAYAVMPPGHPLAEHSSVRFEHIVTEPLVMPPTTSLIRQWLDGRFSQRRLVPQVVMETSSVYSACLFSAQGLGVTIADPFAIRAMMPNTVDFRPLEPAQFMQAAFVLPLDHPTGQTAQCFMDAVREQAKPLVAPFKPTP